MGKSKNRSNKKTDYEKYKEGILYRNGSNVIVLLPVKDLEKGIANAVILGYDSDAELYLVKVTSCWRVLDKYIKQKVWISPEWIINKKCWNVEPYRNKFCWFWDKYKKDKRTLGILGNYWPAIDIDTGYDVERHKRQFEDIVIGENWDCCVPLRTDELEKALRYFVEKENGLVDEKDILESLE